MDCREDQGGFVMRKIAIVCFLILQFYSCQKEEESDSKSQDMDLLLKEFSQVENEAVDQTINFYMWGGNIIINKWIDTTIIKQLNTRFKITLNRIPMDARDFVKIMEKEKDLTSGSIDLVWINGGNFKNAKEKNLLFGPFTNKLPNFNKYVDPKTVKIDFGYPTDGYESPWGKVQFVFIYDSINTQNPPKSFKELEFWIKENPGKFTYPHPESFQGAAFLRQLFYAVTGGYEQYLSGYNEEVFIEKSKPFWEYLKRIEPFLWDNGRTYPKDINELETLLSNREIDIFMAYNYASAQNRIVQGIYPQTVRTFIMEEGSLYNTHFLAIPANSKNKAAALVTANFLLSPEIQYLQNLSENWGSMTVLSLNLLDQEYREKFNSIDFGEAVLPLSYLADHAVPEILSDFNDAIERDWVKRFNK